MTTIVAARAAHVVRWRAACGLRHRAYRRARGYVRQRSSRAASEPMRWGDAPGTLSRMNHVDHRYDGSARPGGQLVRWLKGLGWRHDVALPVILLVLQLAGAVATVAGHHSPATHLGAADWLLLVVGPLSLLFWRRWPVAVLWVAFAATLTPSGAWSANLSLIVAFFLAATSGHRRAALVVIVVGYLCSVWLAPLAYGNPTGSLTFALALAGRAGPLR